jgi:hypothetical protein
MKIDPMQMKKDGQGNYTGEVTPTRFTFASDRLVYPLRITQISVPEKTEALFYIQASQKMDLPGAWTYQMTWAPMWHQAIGMAVPQKVTPQEQAWRAAVAPQLGPLSQQMQSASRELSG